MTAISKAHPYLVSSAAMGDAQIMPTDRLRAAGGVGAKIVYGMESSFMIATRDAGYHSAPHSHDCEQMNYVLEGALWIFVGDGGFLARAGDFFRIPHGEVHWSITAEGPCTMIESHVPGLTGDVSNAANAVGLFAEAEDASQALAIPTDFVEVPNTAEIEARVMRAWPIAAA